MGKRKIKRHIIIFVILVAVIFILGLLYLYLISPVDRNDNSEVKVTIESGYSTKTIGNILKEKRLIKSSTLFLLEMKVKNHNSLKAAKYSLKRSMSLNEIIDSLENSKNINTGEVRLTFKEGMRITDYAKVIEKNTNNSYDEVINKMKDKTYISTLINKYWFLNNSILNNSIYYPLEGYLAPDTYHFDDKDVSIDTIIDNMLKQEEKVLEPYKSKISNNIHRVMTMASIVELEGTNTENRKMIVGIFNNRLKINMNLGSDVTTYYAFQKSMTEPLDGSYFSRENPYNTRATSMGGKMPVGPICNVSVSSIEASVNPTDNDYYYFVADKNKKIYYTKTGDEHNKKIAELKAKGDWLW